MKGNHKNPQPVTPVYNRKIARNRLKRAIGSNRIQRTWQRLQIKRLGGIKQYIVMRILKKPRSKQLNITIE